MYYLPKHKQTKLISRSSAIIPSFFDYGRVVMVNHNLEDMFQKRRTAHSSKIGWYNLWYNLCKKKKKKTNHPPVRELNSKLA